MLCFHGSFPATCSKKSPHAQYKYLSTQVIWTKLGLKNSQGCLLMLNAQRVCFHQWESNSYCMVTRCSLSSIGNRRELVLKTMEACYSISWDSTWKAQTKNKKIKPLTQKHPNHWKKHIQRQVWRLQYGYCLKKSVYENYRLQGNWRPHRRIVGSHTPHFLEKLTTIIWLFTGMNW